MYEIDDFVKRKHRVLVVDDMENNRRILQSFLIKNNYEVEIACDGQECLNVAREFNPDLIILDVMMPVMNGYDACRKIRDDEEMSDIPVVFITAKHQQHDIIKGFTVGGNDYIVKPFFFQEVLLRIKVHIENKLFKEKLLELSMNDPLTSVMNRRCFIEKAGQEIERNKRYGGMLGFVIFDIDDFKKINDSYGHDAGDDVLVGLSERVVKNIRKTDFFCRWGGEEFVVLFVESAPECTYDLCEKLRHLISDKSYPTRSGELKVTVSFGMSSSTEVTTEDWSVETLCTIADKRLYIAKNTGKDRVVFK